MKPYKVEMEDEMAESMTGLHRSHRCTEVSNKLIDEKVTVMGWVQKRRNLGSLIFIDLRLVILRLLHHLLESSQRLRHHHFQLKKVLQQKMSFA